jgi:hypothetical protein
MQDKSDSSGRSQKVKIPQGLFFGRRKELCGKFTKKIQFHKNLSKEVSQKNPVI